VTIEKGGAEALFDGGRVQGFRVSNGTFLVLDSGGSAYGTTVLSGGTIIFGGGAATDVTVLKGGSEMVEAGGELIAGSGTVARNVTVEKGGNLVYAGGVVSGTVVKPGGFETIASGIVKSHMNILAGAILIVSGEADFAALAGHASMIIRSGGQANQTVVSSGTSVILSGGVAEGDTLHGTFNQYAGSAYDTKILAGGVQRIYGGYVAGAIISSGGMQDIGSRGEADNAVVLKGGTQYVFSGGVAQQTEVDSGGSLVIAGGTLSGAFVAEGGQEIVAAGGVLNLNGFDELEKGSKIVVRSGGEIVFSEIESANVQILSGGIEGVVNGGSVVGTAVRNGIELLVSGGGYTSGVTIFSGSREVIGSAGSAVDTVVSRGGLEALSAGALQTGVTISAGAAALMIGGAIKGATVSGGVLNELDGVTSNVTVISGIQYIGGSLFGHLPAHPTQSPVASHTVVGAGGKEIVSANGSANGTTVLSGGTIVFDGGKVHGLSISSGATIDLANLAFSGGTIGFAENGAHTAGTLTVTEGTVKQSVTLFGQYVAAGFSLSKDGNGGTDIHYAPISAAHVPLTGHH
jgi:autotransporter passenger strand-loop-strand repeat protein